MPNWCYTEYKIYGDKEQRDKLFSAIEELSSLEKPRVENGFGKLWLGCLLDYFGGDYNKLYCRGDINEYKQHEGYLQMNTCTAWGECNEVREYLEKVLPGIKMYYWAETEANEIDTNDDKKIAFPWRYYLDTTYSDLDSDYFETLDEVAKYLNSCDIKCEPNIESICQAIYDYQEEHDEEEFLELVIVNVNNNS